MFAKKVKCSKYSTFFVCFCYIFCFFCREENHKRDRTQQKNLFQQFSLLIYMTTTTLTCTNICPWGKSITSIRNPSTKTWKQEGITVRSAIIEGNTLVLTAQSTVLFISGWLDIRTQKKTTTSKRARQPPSIQSKLLEIVWTKEPTHYKPCPHPAHEKQGTFPWQWNPSFKTSLEMKWSQKREGLVLGQGLSYKAIWRGRLWNKWAITTPIKPN